MRIPLLSFFTGGGFLDIGFEQAGFNVVWTNEIKSAFADMYEAGLSSLRKSQGRFEADAKVAARTSITNLKANEIFEMAFGSDKPSLFGIVGGSPCPDFSVSGNNEGVNGERGKLTQVFVNLICDIRPPFFVMENVPGLFRQKKHKPYLKRMLAQFTNGKAGYIVDVKILNALEFGVPQERERVFIIGFQKEFISSALLSKILLGAGNWFPWPEPVFPGAKHYPWPGVSPFGGNVSAPANIPVELTVNPLLSGNVEDLPNGNEVFKAYSKKFWQIDEGDVSGKSFKRLHRYRYSPTAWYGNNEVHIHPWKPRRLSVREALRIQTVPDEYILPPDFSLTDKFKMITNGVPCQLAEHLAQSIMTFLGEDCEESSINRSRKAQIADVI